MDLYKKGQIPRQRWVLSPDVRQYIRQNDDATQLEVTVNLGVVKLTTGPQGNCPSRSQNFGCLGPKLGHIKPRDIESVDWRARCLTRAQGICGSLRTTRTNVPKLISNISSQNSSDEHSQPRQQSGGQPTQVAVPRSSKSLHQQKQHI